MTYLPRETCPKTGKLCAAGCTDSVYGMKRTGYCYEKDVAGDYRNSTLLERARIVTWLRARGRLIDDDYYSDFYELTADAIERGDHVSGEKR